MLYLLHLYGTKSAHERGEAYPYPQLRSWDAGHGDGLRGLVHDHLFYGEIENGIQD